MKFLLDTHAFLWYLLGDRNLSLKSKGIIDTRENLYFSIVSLWEIAIKINIGKLQIYRPIEDLFKELQYSNIQILPILTQDIELSSTLNFPSNHRDPFDRMLIVQAINLSLVVISKDVKFDDYPIQRLWD
ncbi:type II toxin-antitoxin system VapC family toxin [Calothrix sp. UHCC 0171]|uniref:type II toxin-antitoxin system VapC family toxin n=1 Tax=Calothrix sp. UHCC 0171 TaxID=3110245 RepID=UPI002B2005B8|nr:type II toxin-antitoxin system VapC family toxin [Calothrix sp. UHCC 0171]MEA5573009.1 type II toxin-antitoxin system VapC family toxin [Calothrix sp. UHCC 0171]